MKKVFDNSRYLKKLGRILKIRAEKEAKGEGKLKSSEINDDRISQ